jgi:hypothetical protein
MKARAAELLPIPYFHVVFTLPQEIGPIALQNKRVVYGVLFRAAAETLKELAADPKHLGAEIGVLAVLHTWGQSLVHHAHLHCVVTGGGISPDCSRWVYCKRSRKSKKRFFIHVSVLGQVFRGKFIDFLKREYRRGALRFFGELSSLAQPAAFERWLTRSVRQEWVVFAKRPFGSAERVLKYLARYTHRVAISNGRLIDMRDGKVRFRMKDYADGGRWKSIELEATEFIRRFLLHVLPQNFMKIRQYGFLANRFRKQKLQLCRKLLGVHSMPADTPTNTEEAPAEPEEPTYRCPLCRKGRMVPLGVIPVEKYGPKPKRDRTRRPRSPPTCHAQDPED